MTEDTGQAPALLRVDGGAAANDFLCAFQADVLGIPVERPKNLETTAAGAAFLAGLASGFWSGEQEVAALRQAERVFEPTHPESWRQEQMAGWKVPRALLTIDTLPRTPAAKPDYGRIKAYAERTLSAQEKSIC